MSKPLNEGISSVNVEEQYDVSRIQQLAGIANASTVAGTLVAERINDDIGAEDAQELAGQLETLVHSLDNTLSEIEHIIQTKLPREYGSMKHYTFAHIKASIGGHGYAENRMAKSLYSLVEDLIDYSEGGEDTV